MAYYSQVVGTGSGLPDRIMTNAEFETFIDTSDEWIRTRTGIESRRIADASKGETTLTFAEIAARNALDAAGMQAEELECFIVGTVTPDSVMPTTANLLQARLGSTRGFSFDLQAACSGFLYGLSIADAFIRTGQCKTALVVGAETLSSIINWRDRGTCVLFGDAAGAVILKRTEDPAHSIVATEIHSDGRFGEILQIPHGYGKVPPHSAEYRHDMHKVHMQGAEIFKLAVRSMVESSQALLDGQNLKPEDVDYFIFHQANMRIIDMCMKALSIPPHKTWLNVKKYGNTSAATLPVAFDEAMRANEIGPGKLVLLSTFGGGVTWGSTLIRL